MSEYFRQRELIKNHTPKSCREVILEQMLEYREAQCEKWKHRAFIAVTIANALALYLLYKSI